MPALHRCTIKRGTQADCAVEASKAYSDGHLGSRPLLDTITPSVGDVYQWDGENWTPIAVAAAGGFLVARRTITGAEIIAGVPITVATAFVPGAAIGSVVGGMNVDNMISVDGINAWVTVAMSDGINPSPFNANDVLVLTVVQ